MDTLTERYVVEAALPAGGWLALSSHDDIVDAAMAMIACAPTAEGQYRIFDSRK